VTSRQLHILSIVPIAVVVLVLGFHPLVVVPLAVGVLLPELDTVAGEYHRSWLLHTFLVPALGYQMAVRVGFAGTWIVLGIHFVTLGMLLHFLADYIYPKKMSHSGSEWPVRPTFRSAPWGLIWLGISWAVQWFAYLSPAFLPWLAGF
jgi:hypothetical protein